MPQNIILISDGQGIGDMDNKWYDSKHCASNISVIAVLTTYDTKHSYH